MALLSKASQQQVDEITKKIISEIWTECSKVVTAVAAKNGYDYALNLKGTDARGFPMVVGRVSKVDDITGDVVALMSARGKPKDGNNAPAIPETTRQPSEEESGTPPGQ
ncbi:MAG: OmpH family outer membrane protein [Akkermansiaceae bacterium]|nr:OmpH family outer membrane protein [Akkermansiaceae bacterium]